MKVKVVVEVSTEEMAEIRKFYGDSWTNEEIMFERSDENYVDVMQNIEVKIIWKFSLPLGKISKFDLLGFHYYWNPLYGNRRKFDFYKKILYNIYVS